MNILKNKTDCVISGSYFSTDVRAKVMYTCKAAQNSSFFLLYVTLGQTVLVFGFFFFALCIFFLKNDVTALHTTRYFLKCKRAEGLTD